ncbi:MAG: hypothetical protein KJ077_37525 [Anaerolineae bacterium]|nr:hypothetical protein [Anaerolineae bacterium]
MRCLPIGLISFGLALKPRFTLNAEAGRLSFVWLSLTLWLLAGCAAAVATTPPATNLKAVKVDEATLDSTAGFWANAPKLEVPTKAVREGKSDGPAVTLQAAYDATNLVIRAEWADPTNSNFKDAWKWDGSAFARIKANEDRLMYLWSIGNDAQFASKGCAAACHNQNPDEKTWWMGTENADLRYDIWQWQAARTNPVGQASDEWLGTRPDEKSKARRGDKRESGGAALNRNEEKTAPAFMHSTDLASSYLLAGQEAPVDPAKLTPDMLLPGYIISPFVGSAGDISAQGQWADGKWVVVLMRALNTTHEDDVTLTPPKPLPFGLAITDDAGDHNHTVSQEALTLEWQ